MTGSRIDAARARYAPDDRALFDRAEAGAYALPHVPQNVVLEALCLVGLQPSDLEYQQRLYPHDDPAQARDMALHQSGCGLAREAELDAAGISGPWTGRSYASRIGTALSAEIAAAKAAGAWVDVYRGAPFDPQPGDGVVIGAQGLPGLWGKGGRSDEHILCVVLVDGDTVISVDGGQPAVLLRSREIRTVRDEVWLAAVGCPMDPSDGRPSKARRVFGYSSIAVWAAAPSA